MRSYRGVIRFRIVTERGKNIPFRRTRSMGKFNKHQHHEDQKALSQWCLASFMCLPQREHNSGYSFGRPNFHFVL